MRDAAAMWQLAKESGALDINSPYMYLTLCHHFSDSCIVARDDDAVAGFIAGFCPPKSPDTVFVWQITVAPAYRGRGVGLEMLTALVSRVRARYLEATVTPTNEASQRMFRALARELDASCEERSLFGAALFPEPHEDERLLRIGPIGVSGRSTVQAGAVVSAGDNRRS